MAGRDQREPMERLVRIAATLKVAGNAGVPVDKLIKVAGFSGDHPQDQLSHDLKHLRDQGWQIDNIASPGEPARYRMVTIDNRFRVRLTPGQQAALQRAVLLANRPGLVERLGLPASETPPEIEQHVSQSEYDDRLSKCLDAVRHRRRLHFRYGGKPRKCHPESVRAQNEKWYLRAREAGEDQVKAFVVRWMSDVNADGPGTAEPVATEPDLTLHPMRWQVDPSVEVTVRTTATYRPDVERWLGEPDRAEQVADQDLELAFRVTNRAALRVRLYELGPRVQLVGPEEIRREVLEDLAGWAGESA